MQPGSPCIQGPGPLGVHCYLQGSHLSMASDNKLCFLVAAVRNLVKSISAAELLGCKGPEVSLLVLHGSVNFPFCCKPMDGALNSLGAGCFVRQWEMKLLR